MSENMGWSEENSRSFLETARYYVPDRAGQTQALISLISDPGEPFQVLELACGSGYLAGALLERFPRCRVTGLDGSEVMLQAARRELARFGDRFRAEKFDLFETNWRHPAPFYQAVLSSLALHHLDDAQKAALFGDVFRMLHPGGAFLIADILRPAGELARRYAADAYDDIVRKQALEIDGDLRAFEQFGGEQWNLFRYPDDPTDKPSTIIDQCRWLEQAGFQSVDVFWMQAGHAVFGGYRPSARPYGRCGWLPFEYP
jgi:tRNA (cmo5U34)-methyltransferase